eukprot:GEZU01019824.1.p1 GENE.GEZU01019824.1~~GEZU01019824.1.p1  ORF type:complete len:157 (+),score=11.99 GEZU01019824.1:108-578(+)
MSTKKKQHEKVFELSEEDCLRLAREEQEEEKRRQDEIAARAREKAQKEQRKRREKLLRPILYAIVGIIWSLLFYLFIRLEFGTVFFIVSAMGAIAFSMNYDANNKDSYRLSPWSVFNKGTYDRFYIHKCFLLIICDYTVMAQRLPSAARNIHRESA